MRILRKHDAEIEKQGGYDCMRCLSKSDYHQTEYERIAHTFDEVFRNFAWPGGDTVIFTTDEGDILCAECAKKVFILEKREVTADIYYEGPTMQCDGCGREIESSYGDPDAEEEEER